jgi:hypothetical protein
MAFYTGRGTPGSEDFEIEEFEGFPVSKCGRFWGSTQEIADNAWKSLIPKTRRERRKENRKK